MSSMMPVAYIEENRLFDVEGNPYAVYIVQSQPYAFQNKQNKESVISRVISGLSGYTGDLYLYLLCKQLDVSQIMNDMRRHGSHESWKEHMRIAQNRLVRTLPFTRLNIVVVPLDRKRVMLNLSGETWQEWMTEAFRSVVQGVRDVKEKLYSKHVELPQEVLDNVREQSADMLLKLSPLAQNQIRPATLHEVEWWLKKPYFRGIADPQSQIPNPFPAQIISRSDRNVIRPIRTSIHTLANVMMDEKINRLVIKHSEEVESHQTFYVTTNVPQPIPPNDPTGYEWLYGVTETLRFPVDVALHIRIESHKEALENLKGKKRTAESQEREWKENNQDVPLELKKEKRTVAELEAKLRNRQPFLHVTTVFALGANSRDQLKARETTFAEQAGKYHTLVRSAGDMKRNFQAFYPFGEEQPDSWAIPMDPGVLAAAVPFGTRELGDPTGFCLGTLSTGKEVFMDPPRAAQVLNTASAMMFVGKLGSGKTYSMMIITYILLSWGAVGFAIDPKGDFTRFANIPSARDDIRLVSFTHDSDTPFTPFRLGNTKAQSSEAVSDILELILNPKNTEERNIVLKTAKDNVYKGEKWDMFAFQSEIEAIQDHHPEEDFRYEAKIIRHKLENLKEDSIGKLLYGRDTGENVFDRKFLVAIVRGLQFPKHGTPKSDWSEGERLSAAMLYASAQLGLKQLMSFPKDQVKVLTLDEVWVLREFEAGRKLYNEALRLSRSENLIPLMGSQNATDFEAREGEDDITGLFGWKFMYRLDSLAQVKAALRIMGMTDEDPNKWIKIFSDKYKKGYGLVKDPEGRIGELQVELIDKSLDVYFSSTPGDAQKMVTA